MLAFIDQIYHLKYTKDDYLFKPYGPVHMLCSEQLAVSSFIGEIFYLESLSDKLRLEARIPPIEMHHSPYLDSFTSDIAGKRLTGRIYSNHLGSYQVVYSLENGVWRNLDAPRPLRDGAPRAKALLGGFIGKEIFTFHVLPRFGRLTRETLFFSRYDADGKTLSSLPLMTAAERPHTWCEREVLCTFQQSSELTIAYVWGLFWQIDRHGVTKMLPPSGLLEPPTAISAIEEGRVLLYCEEKATICELDIEKWTCSNQSVLALLRKYYGQYCRPVKPEIVILRNGWVLLYLYDRIGLNRTGCWLWERDTNRAWGIPLKEFNNEDYLYFTYSRRDDRVVVSTNKMIMVSKPLTEILVGLEKTAGRAKLLNSYEE